MANKKIYMDNAATTKVAKEVLDAMLPYYQDKFYNPSSVYESSQDIKADIEKARLDIANILNCDAKEIFFTSCGTESDNWAIKGTAYALKDKGKHIITSAVEHHAVLHSLKALEKEGFEVSYVNVDEDGIIKLDELKKAIRKDTILITVMMANNEIGTIEPIKEIAKIAHENNIIFHTDAVQAFAHIPIDVRAYDIDMLSVSAHKFNGPKGVGLLYVKKGIKINNFMDGGGQERKRRAGTENVAGIVGMATAAKIAVENMKERTEIELKIRDHLIDRILKEIPYSRLNGSKDKRLPNNVNIGFEFIEGESMLLQLDFLGVCASSGSACTSGSLDPSHVLLAIGLPHEKAHGSLRLSIDHTNTMEDADFVVDNLKEIVANLREMSPLYADFIKNKK